MHLLKILAGSNCAWIMLKMLCFIAFVANVYLLLQLFNQDNVVPFRQDLGIPAVVRPTVVHPLAHLLPSESQQTDNKKCSQPKLTLAHDALSFAFHPMKPLNCSGSNFFYFSNGYLVPNDAAKNQKKLKMCEVFAVKRESDSYNFLEKLIETPGNIAVKINQDFVFVRCHFRDDNDTKFGTEQGEKGSVKYANSSAKAKVRSANNYLHSKAVFSDTVDHTSDSFREIKIGSISVENNSHFVKLHSDKTVDSAVSNFHRVARDVHKNIRVAELNHNDIGRAKNYSKSAQAPVSHTASEGVVRIEKSIHVQNRPSIGVLRYIANSRDSSKNISKSHFEQVSQETVMKSKKHELDMRSTVQKVMNKYKTVKSTQGRTKQKNLNFNGLSKNTIEPEAHNVVKIENNERTLPDIEEEYSDFGDSGPAESEHQDFDGNLYDDWLAMDLGDYHQLDKTYIEVPGCDEEQYLVQVSPLKHVFSRYQIRKSQKTSGLNVLMFGIDSMSSMAFQRKLPLTLNFLKQELDAVIFDSYNIVGDGTTQALLPMFLGKLQHEISNIHYRHLDDLDFVWKHYQKHGYVTMFAEDEPHLGVFNLRLHGFEEQPTDHYMRHFWQSQAQSHLKIGCSAKYCTGSTPNHQYLLQYLNDFFHKYPGMPHFAVGYSGELSHDDVNPSEYLDKDLHKFIAGLKADGRLNNMVLVVFADHGSRKGKLRRTLQGKIEERLPFFSMVFPKSFKRQYKILNENLRKNARGLTSAFDIHETLLDLLDLSKVNVSEGQETKRGVSLFRPIPENRTCIQAGIDTHWCTCVQEKPVPTSEPVVKEAAEAIISAINNLTLANRHQCALLRLVTIHAASLVVPNLQVLKFHRTEETSNFAVSYGNTTLDMVEFQITIETDNCRGVFEATVQVLYHQNDTVSTDGSPGDAKLTYNVFEHDISRINAYGSQSGCICEINPHIMKFCCCNSFLLGEQLKNC